MGIFSMKGYNKQNIYLITRTEEGKRGHDREREQESGAYTFNTSLCVRKIVVSHIDEKGDREGTCYIYNDGMMISN